MKHLLSWPAILLLVSFITACGGGGGGSAPTPNTPSNPPPAARDPGFDIPQAAPPINYGGLSNKVLVNENNVFVASYLSFTALLFTEISESFWLEPRLLPEGDDYRTIEDEEGTGKVELWTVRNPDGSGYMKQVFDGFTLGELKAYGTVIQRFNSTAKGSIGTSQTGIVDFYDFRYEGEEEGSTLAYQGRIEAQPSEENDLVVNLLVTLDNGPQLYIENYRVEKGNVAKGENNSEYATSLSGSIYDSGFGRIDLTTAAPLENLFVNEQLSIFTSSYGVLQFDGTVPKMSLHALSQDFAAFVADLDGDGVDDQAQRISWYELFSGEIDFQIAQAPPVVNPGLPNRGYVGYLTELHGMFSHDANLDYLSFQWHMFHKPMGSDVSIENANSPKIAFVPDKEGAYLFSLWASDGEEARETTVEVEVLRDTWRDAGPSVTFGGQIEASLPEVPGGPYSVDAGSVFDAKAQSLKAESLTWKVEEASGTAYYDPPLGMQSRLYISQPNNYLVSLFSDPIYTINLSSGNGHYLFEAPLVGDFNGQMYLTADYNKDTVEDLIIYGEAGSSPNKQIRLNFYTRDENQALKLDKTAPITSLTFSPPSKIEAADVNGDQLLDILLLREDMFSVVFQQSSGNFVHGEVYESKEDLVEGCGSAIEPFFAANIDADARSEIVGFNSCAAKLVVWRPTGAGSPLPAPERIALNAQFKNHSLIEVVDFNGDGYADLLLLDEQEQFIKLLLGSGTKQFTLAQTITAPGEIYSITLGDLTQDSLPDLLLSDSGITFYYQYDPVNGLQLADQFTGVKTGRIVDLDGDGKKDILTRRVQVGMQQEDGSFYFSNVETTLASGSSMTTYDLDMDGALDIILIGFPSSNELFRVLYRDKYRYSLPVAYKPKPQEDLYYKQAPEESETLTLETKAAIRNANLPKLDKQAIEAFKQRIVR